MAKIYYDTGMKELPKNCLECKMVSCNLPIMKNKPDVVKKPYLNKRHKECPLVEV